jgi:hypothetical protein
VSLKDSRQTGHTRPTPSLRRPIGTLLTVLLLLTGPAWATSPITTILADFEDDSVAVSVGTTVNIPRTGCTLYHTAIPARGQRSMSLDMGVTTPGASVCCDLRLREPRRFARAEQVAAFCWADAGEFQVAFRVTDALGQLFETAPQTVRQHSRWLHVTGSLDAQELKRVSGEEPLSWPIQISGYRVASDRLGKQTIHFDDLHVEHRVAQQDVIHGTFVLDEPTRIYEPGSLVKAALEVENCSRSQYLQLAVELAWTRPDGSIERTHRATMTLPASAAGFRSRQALDFSQRIAQPGLYRLVGRARADAWLTPAVFETLVVVTPSNRLLPRGTSTFCAVEADLLAEPPADQRLEIALARDVGVHTLALRVPWQSLEPTPRRYDFDTLDPLIDRLIWHNMAPMIVLTDPPEWAESGPRRVAQVGDAFAACIAHYGPKVTLYQPSATTLPYEDLPGLAQDLTDLLARLRQARGGENVRLLSPPIPARPGGPDRAAATLFTTTDGIEWAFRTVGDPTTSRAELRAFRQQSGFRWQPNHWWMHSAQPRYGQTFFADAKDVLHFYIDAALAGVAGLVWYDLRDNDNDPTQPDALLGLVRRDFSPKTSLQGYASAAGIMTGLTCRGPVLDTPAEFDSALLIGGDRQVAALLPKPNRIRPAVVAPIQGVPGKLSVRDFERRPAQLLGSTAPPLVPTSDRPLFVILPLSSPQPEPQLAFAAPWLDLPAILFCGDDAAAITVRPPKQVTRGSIRLLTRREAPFTVTPASQSFSADDDGQEIVIPLRIMPEPEASFAREHLTLRVMLGSDTIDLPLQVRPLFDVARIGPSDNVSDAVYELAHLTPNASLRPSAAVTVQAGYSRQALHLLATIRDDQFIDADASGATTGDQLFIGLAPENADAHVEVSIAPASDRPTLVPAHGTSADALTGWTCRLVPNPDPTVRKIHLEVPVQALGTSSLSLGARFLLAARYVDDDSGLPAPDLQWGGGLDGSRSSEDFNWIRLGRRAAR